MPAILPVVHAPSSPAVAVAAMAAGQHGLVTRQQALAVGMHPRAIDRRLADGSWQPVRRGVYRSAFAACTWHQRALAACLGAAGPVAVSHRAAAYLHGLLDRPPSRIHVQGLRRASPGGRRRIATVHRPRQLPPDDLVIVQAVPVTSLARTLIDLAGVTAPGMLGELVDRALRSCPGERPRADLLARLGEAARSRRRGAPALRVALAPWVGDAERACELESALEAKVMRVLLGAGLPRPDSQHRVELPSLGTVFLDFAWPAEQVALEVDGFAFHSGRPVFERDRMRGNLLLVAGWDVLHTTAGEVRDEPAVLVGVVTAALAARGAGVGAGAGAGGGRTRGRG